MSLDITLDADIDGDVTFQILVRNTGQETVRLRFRTGQRVDVIVTHADTDERVWQWSAGRLFTQAIQHVTLAPGETLSERVTWTDPPAGRYEAEGELKTEDGPTATTTFVVD